MANPLTLSNFKRLSLVASVIVFFIFGVGEVLRRTIDYLLYWDASEAAESWARYVAENVPDIEDIANGELPSVESMTFLIRTQQIRHIFGFEIINLYGNVQLSSDGSKISNIGGSVHDHTAELAAKRTRPVISVKEGTPPFRPKNYSEAYLPVIVNGRPRAIVAAYVDMTEQNDHFRNAFLLATLALCLLI